MIPSTAVGARLDRSRVEATYELIRPHIRVTPVVELLAGDLGGRPSPLTLKLEQLQHAGSFKTRGAFANLLLRQIPEAGVAAASGGNHGAAVAYAAMKLGVPAKIFVPTVSSQAKIDRIRAYGADLVVGGERYANALGECEAWIRETGALSVHAFDQEETLLGQATLGLELSRQAPSVDTVLVSVGGGGLLGGLAGFYGGGIRLVGVEPEGAPTLTQALLTGGPVDAPTGSVAADSLAPKRVGELVFPMAKAHVHSVVLVSDEDILRAQASLWSELRIVAEPGGVAALSALLSGRYVPELGERVAVIVSGANTTAVDFSRPAHA